MSPRMIRSMAVTVTVSSTKRILLRIRTSAQPRPQLSGLRRNYILSRSAPRCKDAMMRAVSDDDRVERFVEAGFEFICERRLGEFVDVERVLGAADAVATEARLATLVARF